MPHPSHVGESWLNLGKCQEQQILVHLPTPDSKFFYVWFKDASESF